MPREINCLLFFRPPALLLHPLSLARLTIVPQSEGKRNCACEARCKTITWGQHFHDMFSIDVVILDVVARSIVLLIIGLIICSYHLRGQFAHIDLIDLNRIRWLTRKPQLFSFVRRLLGTLAYSHAPSRLFISNQGLLAETRHRVEARVENFDTNRFWVFASWLACGHGAMGQLFEWIVASLGGQKQRAIVAKWKLLGAGGFGCKVGVLLS